MLSEGKLSEILENRVSDQTKSYTLQVFDIKENRETHTKIFKLSDGKEFINGGIKNNKEIQENDLIEINEKFLLNIKKKPFIMIKEYNRMNKFPISKIGSPIEFQNLVKNHKRPPNIHLPKYSEDLKNNELTPFITEDAKSNSEIIKIPDQHTEKKQKIDEEFKSDFDLFNSPPKLIKDLDLHYNGWTIEIRLLSKKNAMQKPKKHDKKLEQQEKILEIVDSRNTKIEARLTGSAVEKYDKILQEGKCYRISYGYVKSFMQAESGIPIPECLILDESTEIMEMPENPKIPQIDAKYINLAEVDNLKPERIIDVMGIIVNGGSKQLKYGKNGESYEMRKISILDETGRKNVSLWRNFAEVEIKEGEIIGFKNLKITEFYGNKELNTIASTQIIHNISNTRTAKIRESYKQFLLSQYSKSQNYSPFIVFLIKSKMLQEYRRSK